MKIKAVITGATGMVGEGVPLECLNHPDVEQVLVINRKPGGVSHPKLREIIHIDFFHLTSIESQLSGFDACFFCLGVSSVGISKEEYKRNNKYLAWLYPIGRALYPAGFCTLQEVGLAMINAVTKGYPKQILEVKDIVNLAQS